MVLRYNANGTTDGTFGPGGRRTTDLGGAEVARDVAVQPDGKIVVAGTNDEGHSGGVSHFCLARFTGGGAPDASFGRRGKVTSHFGRERESARAVA